MAWPFHDVFLLPLIQLIEHGVCWVPLLFQFLPTHNYGKKKVLKYLSQVLSQTLEIYRFSLGPLPSSVCCFQNLIKCSFLVIIFLLTDAVVITRYVYIFWLKNPASFRDEFWLCFTTAWIYGIALILMISVCFITRDQYCNTFSTVADSCTNHSKILIQDLRHNVSLLLMISVTRLGDLLDFGQLF